MTNSHEKSIDTLVDDIYGVLVQGVVPRPEDVEHFGRQLASLVADRLQSNLEPRVPTLRMSNLGRGDRQLWYELNDPDAKGEELQGHTRLKFLIGDIYESTLLFLARVSGHEVTDEQAEVKLDGIVGHIDAVVDGTVLDVKSASTYAFKKFKDGTLADDDPFGYIEQISGYSTALDTDGAFLAGDKQNGHLALLKVPKEDIKALDIEGRIAHIKEVVAAPEMPERCYPDEPMGESGNRVLGINCSYCPFKAKCWVDANDGVGLRTFIYSKGPVHFTEVVKEPKGPYEVTF